MQHKNALGPLLTAIGAVGMLCYFGGIVWAGRISLHAATKPALPILITAFITAIGATLATHFGAVFGFQLVTKKKALRAGQPLIELSSLQVCAAWAYFISLLIALGFWMATGFSDKTADVIQNLSMTLPGIAAGAIAIALNIPPSSPIDDRPAS